MCLPHELTSSAALSVWVALGELHMKPWCTICLLLTLVAVLSGSFLQCMLKGKGYLIFVRLIPKGSGDGDEVLSVPPLHAPLQKVYKPYWHLGLLHFSLSKDWFSLWSVTKDCPSVLILSSLYQMMSGLEYLLKYGGVWVISLWPFTNLAIRRIAGYFWSVKTRETFSSTPVDLWLQMTSEIASMIMTFLL